MKESLSDALHAFVLKPMDRNSVIDAICGKVGRGLTPATADAPDERVYDISTAVESATEDVVADEVFSAVAHALAEGP